MNDQPENLGPGGKGQLAVLTGEIRGLRKAVEQLSAQLNQLSADAGNEFVQLRERQGQIEATVMNTLNGVIAIHQILTMPAEPEPQSLDPATPAPNAAGVVLSTTVDPAPASPPAPSAEAAAAAEIPAGKNKAAKPAEQVRS